MTIEALCASVEAILFASGEPVEANKIAQVLGVEEDFLHKVMKTMQDKYDSPESGLMLLELSGSFQLCTKPAYGDAVKRALLIRRNTPLSAAAMEVLAVVAYNQPVTKAFVDQVRGVDCGGVMATLAAKGLIEERGRLELPGRPLLYGTTENFLRCLHISSLDELPPLPDEPQDSGSETEDKANADV